jgi:hypothetical protein
MIGGTAVEGAKPLYEEVFDADAGESQTRTHGQGSRPGVPVRSRLTKPRIGVASPGIGRMVDRSGKSVLRPQLRQPALGLPARHRADRSDRRHPRRQPADQPELLDHLTRSFVESGFDVRQAIREICNSRTYQLSVVPNQWNEDDTLNYARAMPRRLPAEVLFDTIHFVTGSITEIPGVPKGTRAAALPDVGFTTEDGFLQNLGQPVRESACECERSNELQLGPVMALVSGPTIGHAISDAANALPRLVAEMNDDAQLVEEIYLRILGRRPTESEMATFAEFRQFIAEDHETLGRSLAEREAWWADEFAKREAARNESLTAAKNELAAGSKNSVRKPSGSPPNGPRGSPTPRRSSTQPARLAKTTGPAYPQAKAMSNGSRWCRPISRRPTARHIACWPTARSWCPVRPSRAFTN